MPDGSLAEPAPFVPLPALKALWSTATGICESRITRKPVLIILHQHLSNPGHVGNWFRAHGYPLDIRRPRYGEPLPDTLEHHTGAVIFGGPQSANDSDPYISRETDWISIPLKEKKPFFGICLGAQMMANQLGGSVGFHHEGCAEIGYYPLQPTEEGRALFNWPEYVYQWHREGFTLPAGAQLLAGGGGSFENQAMQYGPAAFGVQFHPEITYALVNRWSTRASQRLILPGARPRHEHLSGHVGFGPEQRRWLGDFLSHWVTLDPGYAP